MAGIAITVLAWFGPWAWPAWPALVLLDLAFSPPRSLASLPFGIRSAVVVVLMGINVGFWGVICALAWGTRSR